MKLEDAYASIIQGIGEDLERPGLKDTPQRAAKAFKHLTQGYEQDVDSVINGALFPSQCDEMVIVKDIELFSLCEHHLLPFIGKAHVAYIPQGRVLGLSKVARIVDMFSKRLQIQEDLTHEIAQTLMRITDAEGVGVVIEAKHMCMMMRGASKQNAFMNTSVMLGVMKTNPSSRQEFLHFIK
jgi:GTP cyclohydrolase I